MTSSDKWIIIGSVAAKHWFDDFRQPKDVDIMTIKKAGTFKIEDTQWHELSEKIIDLSSHKTFLDPDLLLTLKLSHANWDIHFDKTIFDIHFFKQKQALVKEDLYTELVKVWQTVHGPKSVCMNQKVDKFFKENIPRKHSHEYAHKCVAFKNRPMHESIRPDLSSVWCSAELFKALSFDDQLLCVCEELIVTAIERFSLTNQSSKIEILIALKKAFTKLCTSMTTGWFARFAVENFHAIMIANRDLLVEQTRKALLKLN